MNTKKKEILQAVSEMLDEQAKKEPKHLSIEDVDTGLNLRHSINSIALLESNKDLNLFLDDYRTLLDQNVREERLVEGYISGLSQFSHLDAADTELSAITSRLKKVRQEVDLVKIIELMKETSSSFIVPMIEDEVVQYVQSKSGQARAILLNKLYNYEYDQYVKLIIEIVSKDTSIETVIGESFEEEHLSKRKVYSPVQYIKENECIFNVGGTYYSKIGNNILRVNESSLMNLNADFIMLCEAINNPDVSIRNGKVEYLYNNEMFVEINEGKLCINKEDVDLDIVTNPTALYLKYGFNDYEFANMVKTLYEGYSRIAEVDFVTRLVLNENTNQIADVFNINKNLFVATHNKDIHVNRFYRNVNSIQRTNILNEHFNIDLNSIFESKEDKLINEKIENRKSEYESQLKELVSTRKELAGILKKDNDNSEIKKALSDITKDIKKLEDEYKAFQRKASKFKQKDKFEEETLNKTEKVGEDDEDTEPESIEGNDTIDSNIVIDVEGEEVPDETELGNPLGDEFGEEDDDFGEEPDFDDSDEFGEEPEFGMEDEEHDFDGEFGEDDEFGEPEIDADFDNDFGDEDSIEFGEEEDEMSSVEDHEFEEPYDDIDTVEFGEEDEVEDEHKEIDSEVGYDPESFFNSNDLEQQTNEIAEPTEETPSEANLGGNTFSVDRIEFTRDIKGRLGTSGFISIFKPTVTSNKMINSETMRIGFTLDKSQGKNPVDVINLQTDKDITPAEYHDVIQIISNTKQYRDIMDASPEELIQMERENAAPTLFGGFVAEGNKGGKKLFMNAKSVFESEEEMDDFLDDTEEINDEDDDLAEDIIDDDAIVVFDFLRESFENLADIDDEGDLYVDIVPKEDIIDIDVDNEDIDKDLFLANITYNAEEYKYLCVLVGNEIFVSQNDYLINTINTDDFNNNLRELIVGTDENVSVLSVESDDLNIVLDLMNDITEDIFGEDAVDIELMESKVFKKKPKSLQEDDDEGDLDDLFTFDTGDSLAGVEGEEGSDTDNEIEDKVEKGTEEIEDEMKDKKEDEDKPKLIFKKKTKDSHDDEESDDLEFDESIQESLNESVKQGKFKPQNDAALVLNKKSKLTFRPQDTVRMKGDKYSKATVQDIHSDGTMTIIQNGMTIDVKQKDVINITDREDLSPDNPFRNDKMFLEALEEKLIPCKLVINGNQIINENCYVKYSDFNNKNKKQVRVLVEAASGYGIASNGGRYINANIEDIDVDPMVDLGEDLYVPGVIVDMTGENASKNVLVHSVEYMNAEDEDTVSVVMKDSANGKMVEMRYPKYMLKTLSV